MRYYKKTNSKIFSPEEHHKNVSPGPAVALDGPAKPPTQPPPPPRRDFAKPPPRNSRLASLGVYMPFHHPLLPWIHRTAPLTGIII